MTVAARQALRMPDLSAVPAPLAQLAEWHRAACRVAERHGLNMGDPADHPRIAALMGWTLGEVAGHAARREGAPPFLAR